MNEAPDAGGRRRLLSRIIRIVGIALAVAAVAFLVATLVEEWPAVSEALSDANPTTMFLAWVLSLGAMWGLAVLWFATLAAFGSRRGVVEVSAWYFAGELGKYLPGGIWPVVGRGELANRSGVKRSVAYGTTMLSLALMILGGLLLSLALVPFSLGDLDVPPALYLVLVVVPLGLVALHPAVVGRVLRMLSRASKGRVELDPAPWVRMLGLVVTAVPTWILVGLGSWVVGRSLGYEPDLARTMLASTLAWAAGFLAVPVPAGAGIREVVFVAVSGLGTTEATVVATVSRFLFILVDGAAGLVGLAYVRANRILTDESP